MASLSDRICFTYKIRLGAKFGIGATICPLGEIYFPKGMVHLKSNIA